MLKDDTVRPVREFYDYDEISRCMPGKIFCVVEEHEK
jgi:hypothetical protein